MHQFLFEIGPNSTIGDSCLIRGISSYLLFFFLIFCVFYSRHYQSVSVIKEIIESMAFAKLNVFHWYQLSLPQLLPNSFPHLKAYNRYTIVPNRNPIFSVALEWQLESQRKVFFESCGGHCSICKIPRRASHSRV